MKKFSALCDYADAAAEMLANTEWDFFGNEAADTKSSTSAFEKYVSLCCCALFCDSKLCLLVSTQILLAPPSAE